MDHQKKILDFWFGELADEKFIPTDKAKMWFEEGKKHDGYIQENFGSDLELAIKGELDSWKETPCGRLALIILIDQFSRHIYRNSPKAFKYDEKALDLCLEGILLKHDEQLYPIQRSFFYLPLEHSEDISMQIKSLEQYNKLAADAPKEIEFMISNSLNYAKQHYDIVACFGRFPHRNKVLGRASTLDEAEFLKKPGSSF